MRAIDWKQYIDRYKEELLDRCVPFWTANMVDTEHGGIYSYLDRDGTPYSTDKAVWMQGRTLWTFSALSRQYGPNAEWLSIAKRCKDFLDRHCFDSDGRMFFIVTADGRPLRKRRYFFSETFYCLGSAVYARASGDAKALEDAKRVYRGVKRIYQDPSRDPFVVPEKYVYATRPSQMFGAVMQLLLVVQALRDADSENAREYEADAREYADKIANVFYQEKLGVMPEVVSPEGALIADSPNTRIVKPGHAMEAVWILLHEADRNDDAALRARALEMMDGALNIGWDEKNGGVFYMRDALGKPLEELEAYVKVWWVHCEALVALLSAYGASGRETYLEKFAALSEYCFARHRDPEHGEWYPYLDAEGNVTHRYKGSLYKGPFHVERALMMCIDFMEAFAKDGKATGA